MARRRRRRRRRRRPGGPRGRPPRRMARVTAVGTRRPLKGDLTKMSLWRACPGDGAAGRGAARRGEGAKDD